MTPAECATVLAVAQSYDRRTVGEVDVVAWHRIIGRFAAVECREAVVGHYAKSREWCMPFDVVAGVKAMRADRRGRALEAVPDADPDDVPSYLTALRDGRTRSGGNTKRRDLRAIAGTFRDAS